MTLTFTNVGEATNSAEQCSSRFHSVPEYANEHADGPIFYVRMHPCTTGSGRLVKRCEKWCATLGDEQGWQCVECGQYFSTEEFATVLGPVTL
jgi:hypothetical protein